MIEACTFLAAFTLQILVGSVLQPIWFTRYVRAKADAQFPGLDRKSLDRFLSLYRVVTTGIALLGLPLLGYLFNQMRSPHWDIAPVILLLTGYSMAQFSPIVVASLIGARIKGKALLSAPPQAKRTASLQRRGLFEIVSPFTVVFAVAAYFLFAAFAIHIQQHPIAGNFGYILLADVTFSYVLSAITLYWLLYRRKRWPLETPAYRLRAVEVQVKIIFYISFAVIVFLSLFAALIPLNLVRWAPIAMSVYFMITTLIVSMVLLTLRRQAETDRLGPTPVS